MAAPVRPETDKDALASLRGEVYLDDVGDSLKAQDAQAKADSEAAEAKKKAEDQAKLQAEAQAALPADPRVKALEEALKISEEARKRAAALTAPPPPAPPKEEKELTAEELKKLWDENPLAAIDQMLDKRTRTLEENVSRRLGSLAASGASAMREAAERKYPDEFRLFGKEITEFLATLPEAEQRMSAPKAWDDLISYMRGQPGNFEKVVKDREERNKQKAADEAHATQAATTGAHTSSQIRTPAPEGGTQLDDIEREIARTMFPGTAPEKAYAEYTKWKKVAS